MNSSTDAQSFVAAHVVRLRCGRNRIRSVVVECGGTKMVGDEGMEMVGGAGELRKWEIARVGGHDGVDDMTCGDACGGGGGRMNSENFGHECAEKHA